MWSEALQTMYPTRLLNDNYSDRLTTITLAG
jgi:hypothetical protein